MPKGYTYFCTDSDGNTYNRYSAGHDAPRYVAATIVRPKGGKATKNGISYSSKPHLNAGTWDIELPNGYKKPKIAGVSEAAAVRAYPGRHTAEPAPNPARSALSRAVNRAIAEGSPVYENKPE